MSALARQLETFCMQNQRDFVSKLARKSPKFEISFPFAKKVLLSEGFHQPSIAPWRLKTAFLYGVKSRR